MKKSLALIILLLCCLDMASAQKANADSIYKRVHFCWGAEAGGSVDLSANDMSTVEFNMSLGFKYRWIKMFGIGAGADIMVSNSCRSFPVYAEFQTDFSTRPRPLFACVKGGVSFNYFDNNTEQVDPYAFGGIGIRFARSSKFNSYMLMGYSFFKRKDVEVAPYARQDIHQATIKLGINF